MVLMTNTLILSCDGTSDERSESEMMQRIAIFTNGGPNDVEALKAAVLFSQLCKARLSVIHPRISEVVATAGRVTMRVSDHEAARQASIAAHAAFDTVCGGLDFAAWYETDTSLNEAIRQLGILHDATILERIYQEEGPEVAALNAALFDGGGPVLVTPPRAPVVMGDTVAVMWSATAQSARAVRSALPILRQAVEVIVLHNANNPHADPVAFDAYLKCHDISASFRAFDGAGLSARARGRRMLAIAVGAGANMLVTGAYGENRLSSIFGLGRATQKVVSASPIPVFIQA